MKIIMFSLTAASFQAGQVVAHLEHSDKDHRQFCGCLRKPHSSFGHHRLHLRRSGHAAVWEELRDVRLQAVQGL